MVAVGRAPEPPLAESRPRPNVGCRTARPLSSEIAVAQAFGRGLPPDTVEVVLVGSLRAGCVHACVFVGPRGLRILLDPTADSVELASATLVVMASSQADVRSPSTGAFVKVPRLPAASPFSPRDLALAGRLLGRLHAAAAASTNGQPAMQHVYLPRGYFREVGRLHRDRMPSIPIRQP